MEQQFVKRFIDDPFDPEIDKVGNRIVRVGDSDRVMFACHTDTVHHQDKRQKVRRRGKHLVATSKHSNCLGADDTAGVWLMVNMIRLGIEGLYIFHYGEEIGCVGAGYIRKHTPELIKDVKISIEFDRRGYTSVILRQCWSESCSVEFAKALCDQLGMDHMPDPGGMFTDNAEYVGIIPEVTNVSVGYFQQHSPQESQDTEYLQDLLLALTTVDFAALPVVRDPNEYDEEIREWSGYRRSGSQSGYMSLSDEQDRIAVLCERYPDICAGLLQDFGVRLEDVHREIEHVDGVCDSNMIEDLYASEYSL
jgi:hypothetical protein